MIRSGKFVWLVAGLFAAIGFVHAAPPAAGADEAAIRALSVNWAKAFNGGDAKAVAALYAEDAVLMPPGAPAAKGAAAILAFITKDIAGAKTAGVTFVLNPKTDVGISGDLGWESGTYTATIKGNVVETGKFLSVSRKKDGKWLYVRDTYNQDAAPAPPAPPAPPAKAPAAPTPAPAAPPAPAKK
ncbi:MAG: nuclear transport factor 2 family protein [Betaproteobacteria bacterium]|nr:nuclear transport factor 2 family protein [Betaproteobacteria bacterium]